MFKWQIILAINIFLLLFWIGCICQSWMRIRKHCLEDHMCTSRKRAKISATLDQQCNKYTSTYLHYTETLAPLTNLTELDRLYFASESIWFGFTKKNLVVFIDGYASMSVMRSWKYLPFFSFTQSWDQGKEDFYQASSWLLIWGQLCSYFSLLWHNAMKASQFWV